MVGTSCAKNDRVSSTTQPEDADVEHELKTVTMRATSGGLTLREAVRECERIIVLEALKLHGNDKRAVARLLKISLSSLYRKIGEEPPVYELSKLGVDLDLE